MSIDINDIYQRTEILIGKEGVNKLKNSKVCICGVGGVGSYTMEALARIGVGNITVIDKDKVDVTNINRQIIATVDNVDKSKVLCAKERISSINPSIKVNYIEAFLDENNVDEYINKDYDYVIDAIDSISSKVQIIKCCTENNIKVISSMGMANKLNPLMIKVSDIYKTNVCPLAKIMRKKLKEERIKKLKVVYTEEIPKKSDTNILGSVSFVPSVAGLVIASEVVKDILDKEEK